MSRTGTRRLAAIVSADIVGYSRLMAQDEERTLARVQALRDEITEPTVTGLGGRVVKRTGDGTLIEFSSVVDAVRAARLVQARTAGHEAAIPQSDRIVFRIGINLGDVLSEGDDIFGDAVNIAARLEQICPPGGVLISGSAYDQFVNRPEFPFRFLGEQNLRNIPHPVRTYSLEDGSETPTAPPPAETSMRQALPGRPSLAVLPFANLSSDPDQAFFCDGISEDVISALSRFGALFVISRNTSFTYRDREISTRDVSRELGVQYVVGGSVRRAGNRIRVTANLVDAITDRPVWSDRYDRDAEDVFAIQDDIVQQIVGAVAPGIMDDAGRRTRRKPAQDLTVWELIVRANDHVFRHTEDDSHHARDLLERALEREPENVAALGLLGYRFALDALYGWHLPPAQSLAAAAELAQTALQFDSRDAMANVVLGLSLGMGRDLKQGSDRFSMAIESNPNLALAIGWKGVMHGYQGVYELSETLLRQALRLSPHDPERIWFFAHLGVTAYFQRDFQRAVTEFRRALAANPNAPSLRRGLTASLAMNGDLDEAQENRRLLQHWIPGVTIARSVAAIPLVRDEDERLWAEGLRRAGLPE